MEHLKTLSIIAALLIIAGCSPAFKAAEAALETNVDLAVDETIERICKGPIDVAVRTAQRYPALLRAAFDVCPDTYGVLRTAVLADVVRSNMQDSRPNVPTP